MRLKYYVNTKENFEKFRYYLEMKEGGGIALHKVDINAHALWRSKHTQVTEISYKDFVAYEKTIKEMNKPKVVEPIPVVQVKNNWIQRLAAYINKLFKK